MRNRILFALFACLVFAVGSKAQAVSASSLVGSTWELSFSECEGNNYRHPELLAIDGEDTAQFRDTELTWSLKGYAIRAENNAFLIRLDMRSKTKVTGSLYVKKGGNEKCVYGTRIR